MPPVGKFIRISCRHVWEETAFDDREEAELAFDPQSVRSFNLVELYDPERHVTMAVIAYKQRPYPLDRRRWRRS